VTSVVRTHELTKVFRGGLVAVDEVDLDVHDGDLFGFLGPNGAGKTTTIRMLLGLMAATRGTIEVLGQPIPRRAGEALRAVGTLIEGPAFYPYLSGTRNLAIFDGAGAGGSRRTRTKRIHEVLERVGLDDVGGRPLKAYSLGMRQRLGLAAALLRAPRLLILDEPTNGLDARGIHELRTMFTGLVAEGTTILLSSHLLAEVELVCTRAAMMSAGRIVAQDRVDALLAPTGWVRIVTADVDDAAAFACARRFAHERGAAGELRVQVGALPSEQLNHALVDAGVRVSELTVERRTLEDVFLERTGDGAIH
jgi:ABC-2 type transport system ATP-binding protein